MPAIIFFRPRVSNRCPSSSGPAIGYVVGGGIMIVGELVEIVFGIDAEGKPLEQIAAPLTVVDG